MSILQLPMSIDDLEYAWLKEDFAEGWGKTGKAILQRNFIFNPNLDTDAIRWTAQGVGVTATWDNVEKFSGAGSLKVVTPGTISGGEGAFSNPNLQSSLVDGDRVSGGIWVKGPVGVNMVASLIGSTGSPGFPVNININFVATGQWQYITAANALVNVSRNPYFYVRFAGLTADTFWVDSAVISKGSSVPPYFDGSYADDKVFDYQWEGAIGNSNSIKKSIAGPPVVAVNLAENATVDTAGGWQTNDGSKWVTSSDSSIFRSPSKSVRVTKIGADNIALSSIYAVGKIGTVLTPCSAGDTVNVSFYASTPFPGHATRTTIIFYDSVGVVTSSLNGEWVAHPSPDGWYRVSASVVAPPNSVNFYCLAQTNKVSGIAVNDQYVNYDDATISIGSYSGDILTGNYMGAPAASRSVLYSDRITIGDLEYEYWAKRSGLLPKYQWTLADHKMTALSILGFNTGTIGERYLEFMQAEMGLQTPYASSDLEMAFYKYKLGL